MSLFLAGNRSRQQRIVLVLVLVLLVVVEFPGVEYEDDDEDDDDCQPPIGTVVPNESPPFKHIVPRYALVSSLVCNANAEQPSSLLANFSFEEWNLGSAMPAGWLYWSQYPERDVSVELENPAHGARALRMYLPRQGMTQVQQYLAVQPRSRYRLTAMTRGGFLGTVSASIEPNLAGSYFLSGTRWDFHDQWQTHTFEFDTEESGNIGVGFRFTGKGVIWLDCVVLEKL